VAWNLIGAHNFKFGAASRQPIKVRNNMRYSKDSNAGPHTLDLPCETETGKLFVAPITLLRCPTDDGFAEHDFPCQTWPNQMKRRVFSSMKLRLLRRGDTFVAEWPLLRLIDRSVRQKITPQTKRM
jgi:hypothetical protein